MLDIIGIVVVIAMYYVIFHDSCEKELSAKGNEMKKKLLLWGSLRVCTLITSTKPKYMLVYMLLSA